MHAAHHELEVRDVVLLILADHQELALRVRCTMQSITAVEHEDLERGDAEIVDQRVDLADVGAIERREMVGVVHPKIAVRLCEDLRVDLRIGAAALHVITTRPHVVEAGRHTALRRRQALAARVLGERPVDAGVHVCIDQPGEREALLAVEHLCGGTRIDTGRHLHDAPVLHGDISLQEAVFLGTDHADILDQQIEFGPHLGHGRFLSVGRGQDDRIMGCQALQGVGTGRRGYATGVRCIGWASRCR